MKKQKHLMRNWIILLVILGVIFFGGRFYWGFLQGSVSGSGEEKAFVVQKGEGTSSIADRLQQEGLIKSAWLFKIKARLGDKLVIEPGDYKLSPTMNLNEVMNAFTKGPLDQWVTLLEGWRVEEMANEINAKLQIPKDKFLEHAEEGYMFPDSYLFNKDATGETIASTMRNTFDQKYTDELQQKIKSKGLTAEQGVILASLVEREARSDEVRKQVASIILKRLKMGMKLDIDATVQYAKDSQALKKGTLQKFWQPITRDDYTGVISPYNTYLNNGLPPGPIANPSLSSLNAVANADPNTPYLFYYHDSKGNSYYARTIEEHNANVANHR